jgi:CheY-like chemotaxis protein
MGGPIFSIGFPHFLKLEPNHNAREGLLHYTQTEALMGQSTPFRAKALIVEDDPMQRQMIGLLLEESDFDVIECESAEAAEQVLERIADSLMLMMTDVNLAGPMDGVELAHVARKYNPELEVIVTSGKPLRRNLPEGAKFWAKPWAPLDIIREAERAMVTRDSRS